IEADLLAPEANVEAFVDHALGEHSGAEADIVHRVDDPGLKHAGAHAVLDMSAALRFEDDAVDALPGQQVGQEQSGGPGADDSDLRAHAQPPNPSTAVA